MKICLFALLLISSSVWSIDFQKTTGSFESDLNNKKVSDVPYDTTLNGTFEKFDESRLPASVEKKEEGTQVTEISGSFK